MKPHRISTSTPETPKLANETLASGKTTTPAEINSETPELHPYLADILYKHKSGKELPHKMRDEYQKEKLAQS